MNDDLYRMSNPDYQYFDLVRRIINVGEVKDDRTGVGTLSVFGHQMRFDLREGFPLLTTKFVNFRAIVDELLWFIRGDTNTSGLDSKIWDAWADENGDLGPVYGKQWRDWGGVDQLKEAIRLIKEEPHSRRIIVNAWNVGELHEMKLPPCHMMYQFNVSGSGEHIDLQLYQRSADVALGLPFNIASYALLLELVARETSKAARHLVHTIGDAHIYHDHTSGLVEQLQRDPLPPPAVWIDMLSKRGKTIFDVGMEDIHLHNYRHHPKIKFQVAV